MLQEVDWPPDACLPGYIIYSNPQAVARSTLVAIPSSLGHLVKGSFFSENTTTVILQGGLVVTSAYLASSEKHVTEYEDTIEELRAALKRGRRLRRHLLVGLDSQVEPISDWGESYVGPSV